LLEQRRARGDAIKSMKILEGIDRVDAEHFFTLNEATTT
jgi:hypothetical protein